MMLLVFDGREAPIEIGLVGEWALGEKVDRFGIHKNEIFILLY